MSYTISDRHGYDDVGKGVPNHTGRYESDSPFRPRLAVPAQKYRNLLKEKGVRQSMSRNRNCLDNAVVENFFGILKSELLYLQKFESMEHFKAELTDYLDYYYNNIRRAKAKLEGLPPAIYRQQTLMPA